MKSFFFFFSFPVRVGMDGRRREGGGKFGFGSTHLTAALRKKTALLFVNQASALAGKGHFSTQPPKCYEHC